MLGDDEARRDPNVGAILGPLQIVRQNHLKNEGCIFDMYRLWQDFSATDSGTVDLSRVKLHSSSVYYHFGMDIMLDLEKAPETCLEGAYVSRGEGRWFMTFVFDYPDWETEIRHERTSVAEKRMARAFMVEFPDGIPASAIPNHLMDFHGDEFAGADPRLQWMLVNIVLNAMMYFSQAYVDVFESRFEGQWGSALKPNVYEYGQPTASTTRWRVSVIPSDPLPVPGVGRARWLLELMRSRAGECAEFEVGACDDKGCLDIPSRSVNRQDTSGRSRHSA